MKKAPIIIVQLIHIEGPLKGQIVELSDPVIKIGRHPTCHLRYPAKLSIISREHAVITRDGNRFKLTDKSSNGTIVNGKKISETFLKDGDVLTISEGGPKVSFLTQITDTPLPPQESHTPPPTAKQPSPPPEEMKPPPAVSRPEPEPVIHEQQPAPAIDEPEPTPAVQEPMAAETQKGPLIIQYGPTLRSFDKLPVQIGKHPNSSFIMDHESIGDVHAEIYFEQNEYCIKDLTGKQMVTINGTPVGPGTIFQQNSVIAFSSNGPFFRYRGNGRLSEEEQEREVGADIAQESRAQGIMNTHDKKPKKKPLSLFQRILRKI